MKIAVLIASHNRRDVTLGCMSRLLPQLGKDDGVYLVDDGSCDGTATAITGLNDQRVNIIYGDGRLYWAKGMRKAWETAAEEGDWDAYLWLNDDTMLSPDAMEKMLAKDDGQSLVIGNLCDSAGRAVYGLNVNGWVNGNCVLVPKKIYEMVGMICGEYAHAWADSDYALRVKKSGFSIVGAGEIGTTEWHPLRPSLAGKSLAERWRLLFDPKGWNIHDLWLLRRRNQGFFAAIVSCLHLATHVILFNHERHKIHERFSSLSCG